MTLGDSTTPLARLHRASLSFGARRLWSDLSFTVNPGEFLAVLGPNGSGKSSLLKVLLGLQSLGSGQVEVVDRGAIGYIPQQTVFEADLALRGRDLVQLGIDGDRWGLPIAPRRSQQRVAAVIDKVGASSYIDRPIGRLSGGEQQRLRVAQALVNGPRLLLCDEPLLSLDMASQHVVSSLINDERQRGAGIIFVTHEINTIFDMVDRVLYMVDGRWAIGKQEEILTGQCLSDLYKTHIDVLRVHGRIVVVNANEPPLAEPHNAHHHGQGR